MKVFVEKISNNQSGYRTPLDAIDGMPNLPQVGSSLILTSSTHESGGIMTSRVLEVKKVENGFEVKTTFSTYLITERKEH